VFEAARNALTKVWSTQKLFLQAHVGGYEESVMLSAYKGEMLGAVSMRKRDITPEGKTWAGDVTEVPEEFLRPLRRIVRELNWTGGGELEMVRDPTNQLWLLEWNPRFRPRSAGAARISAAPAARALRGRDRPFDEAPVGPAVAGRASPQARPGDARGRGHGGRGRRARAGSGSVP
jgi:hypothetical protein